MLSIRYVTLEKEESDPELKLDDLVKLERHGFHFLAQLMLALVQSCILSIESDAGRVSLAVFSVPIIARMCGCPVDKLIIAHNIACSAAMFFICIYVLNHVPTFLQSIKQGSRKLRALFVVRGIGIGKLHLFEMLNGYRTSYINLIHTRFQESSKFGKDYVSLKFSQFVGC